MILTKKKAKFAKHFITIKLKYEHLKQNKCANIKNSWTFIYVYILTFQTTRNINLFLYFTINVFFI